MLISKYLYNFSFDGICITNANGFENLFSPVIRAPFGSGDTNCI